MALDRPPIAAEIRATLAVAAPLLFVLWKLRRLPWFSRHGARAISVIVAAVGLAWLAQRLFE